MAKFDLQGALAEGYTYAEVADYLAQNRDFDLPGARQEGYSDEEIVGYLTRDTGRTFGGTAKDVGVSTYKGLLGLQSSLVGLADIVVPSNLGGLVSSGLESLTGLTPEDATKQMSAKYSPAQQRANRKVEEAEGFFGKAGAMVQSPSTIGHSIVESTPSMLAGGAMGRGLMVAGKVPGLLASAAGEGLVGAGGAHEQMRQESPTGTLTPLQSSAAVLSGIGTGAFNLAGGRLAAKLGFGDIDTMLTTGMRDVVGKGGAKEVAKRIAMGGISEGLFEEMPQSAQEQIWQNAALGKPLLEGVPEAAGQGMVVGAAMGAGANVAARPSHIPNETILAAESVDQVIAEFEADSLAAEADYIDAQFESAGASQPAGALARAPELYRAMYQEAGQRYGVDPNLLAAQGWAESGFDPSAVSPAGAQGIAQFMPGTAQDYGIDPMDPVQAIDGQARYMARMLERYDGDVAKALAAYNAGPGRVDDGSWQNINETQNYIGRIMGELGQEAGPMSAEWAAQTDAAQAYNQARNAPELQLDESIQFGDQQEAMSSEWAAQTETAQDYNQERNTPQLDESIQFTEPVEVEEQPPAALPVEDDVPLGPEPQPVSGEQLAVNESQADLPLTDEPQQRLVPDVPLEQIQTVDNGDGSFSLVHKETGENILDGQTYSSRKEARAAFVQERDAIREQKESPPLDTNNTTQKERQSKAAGRETERADIEAEIGSQMGTGRVKRLLDNGRVVILKAQADAKRIINAKRVKFSKGLPAPTKGWYRFTRGDSTPMSDWDHAMFYEGDPEEVSHYGKHGWEVDASSFPDKEALRDKIVKALEDDLANENYEYEPVQQVADGDATIDEIADSFFPEDIITSAEGYDNSEYLMWLWNRVAEPENIRGIRTPDGAIAFHPEDISRMEIKYSKDGKIQGFTTPDGKVYLVRDSITQGNAMGVLAHEMGVHAKRLGFKRDAEWQGIADSIERRKDGKGRTGQAIRAAMERIPQDTAPEHMQEELVAYLVEHHANDNIPLVDRIVAHIKKWLYKTGIMHADRLSPKDLAVFARGAIRDEARRASGTSKPASQTVSGKASRFMASMAESLGVTAEQLQREYDAVVKRYKGTGQWLKAPNGKKSNLNERQWVLVRTPRFKAWFGNWEMDRSKELPMEDASKVVDANGEPLVVYHGGTVGTTFSTDYAGTGSGRESAFFFTPDIRQARDYAGTGSVKEVFLRLQNPVETDVQLDPDEVARAKGAGHDGYWIVEDGLIEESEIAVFDSTQIKSATGNTGAFDASNPDIRYSVTPKEAEQAEKDFSQDLQDVYEQAPKKFDIRAATPLIKTAEYTLSKIAAGRRALEAVSRRQERKFMLQAQLLDGATDGMNAAERQVAKDTGFTKTFQQLKKQAPRSYAKVQQYLLGVDRTGRGFYLSHESGYVVTTPEGELVGLAKTKEEALTKARDHVRDNGLKGKVLIKDYGTDKGSIWTAHNPNKSKIGTYTNEQEAVAAMIKGERAGLLKRGFSELEANAIQSFREMTNRAFDEHAAGAREVIRRCEEEGIDPPMVEGIDETRRWAVRGKSGKSGKNIATFESREKAEDMIRQPLDTHPRYANAQIVRQKDSEIKKMYSLHDAIAQMGDMRGTYFPRQREHGGMGLRAINEQTGEKIFLKGDLYLANLDPEEKKGFIAQKSDALRKLFNSGTPLGRRARKLRREGFVISFERDTTMPEDVFSAKQLSTNIAALMDEAMQRVDKSSMTPAEVAAYVSMHRAVTDQLAGIIKQRGFLSSRMKRSENYWEGFETDPLKAGTAYANGLAGGVAKRQLAQDLTMIIAGRDITWKQWKEDNPSGDWPEYTEFVNARKIDPIAQKNIYGETMSWAQEVLRNQEAADRIIGTLKGLAVLKYLAFRIPSALVNLSNMALGVPATISSHTGLSIARSSAQINRSLKTLVDYKRGTASALDAQILTEISERGWDNPQFNHDAAAVLRSRLDNTWQGFVDAGMWLFGQAEIINRRATIHAAYRMWHRADPNLTHEELMQKAHHASDRAHGWYGQETAPKWTRGAANPLKAVWTFQKFGQNYLLNIGEMIGKGDYKQAAYMLLAPVVLGGPKATLVTPVLAALAKGLGVGGEDPEEELYAWARDTFGTDAWMRFGAPGMLGVSFQGSLAMGIPVVSDVLDKGKRLNSLAELFGAPGSVVYDTYVAGGHLSKGEYAKAAEKALPSAFGSAFNAWRESTEGVTTGSYGSVYYGADPLKVSGVDTYLRALSFAPAGITGKRQQQWSERKIKDKYAEKRADINREIKRIFLQHDNTLPPVAFAKVLPKIDRYNDAVAGLNRPDITFLSGKSIRGMLKRNTRPSKLERARAMEMFEEENE